MKKNYLLLSFLVTPVILILMAYQSGTPGGMTGSPMDEINCKYCHAAIANNVDGWITTNIPPEGYTPGQTYTISLTGTHPGVVRFGFEITSESNVPEKVGSWVITNPAETQITLTETAVTHTLSGITPTGDTKTWSMNWKAPTQVTGEVVFAAALNAANGDGANSGDVIYTTLLTVPELSVGITGLSSNEIKIYPNPATEFFIIEHAEESLIEIYNLSGSLVMTELIGQGNNVINVSAFGAGVYFVVVVNEDKSTSRKLIVK